MRIKTLRFGKKYVKGLPEYTQGKVVSIKGSKAGVIYEGSDETYDTNRAHLENVDANSNFRQDDVVAMMLYKKEWCKKKTSLDTIMATLEVGCALKKSEESEESSWPKDFFEALVRNDWREWVDAVQKENESWRTFNASGEVKYQEMEQGASIILLGELYTIKRNGQHKFRHYAMGTYLRREKITVIPSRRQSAEMA